MSSNQQELFRNEINKLVAEGIIEQSTSEWCSPTIVVPERDTSFRCVTDFCAINKAGENACWHTASIHSLRYSMLVQMPDVNINITLNRPIKIDLKTLVDKWYSALQASPNKIAASINFIIFC